MNHGKKQSYTILGDNMLYENNIFSFYYKKYGNSPKTIIILPGWGYTRETFQEIIQKLQKEYTIYIVDYPYFGNSPLPNKELTIYDYAETFFNFITELEIINPIIIAHSFGGRITSLLIGKYNLKVDKIVLIDVAGIKRRKKLNVYLKEKIYKLLKRLIRILPKKRQLLIQKKLLQKFASEDYMNLPIIMKKSFQNIIKENLKKYYKKITSETLIIWGEKDIDTPLKDAKLLNKIIKNSGLIIFKNTTHYSYLYNKNLTIKILNSFLNNKSN